MIRNIYRNSLLVVFLLLMSIISQAQNDAQYTQYMYNTISVNPGYTGSRDVLSFNGLYRNQWLGLDDTPETFTIAAHSPVAGNLSVGLNMTRDQIFISNQTNIDALVSYAFEFKNNGKLSIGLKAGGQHQSINSGRLNIGAYDVGDADSEINVDTKLTPQFGAGAYYYTDKFYVGASVPNMLETTRIGNSSSVEQSIREFYLISGYVFDLNKNIKFKPATLFKIVEGAPLQIDVSGNVLLYDKITVGLAYRWSAAVSAMVGYQISPQLFAGMGYDIESTELNGHNRGSIETFLRYELRGSDGNLLSPRFF